MAALSSTVCWFGDRKNIRLKALWPTWNWLISLDKMVAISQRTFLIAVSWMKMSEFRFKFQWYGSIDNKSALVWIMVWRRTSDKSLPECWTSSLTHIYGTRGRWVKILVKLAIVTRYIRHCCLIYYRLNITLANFRDGIINVTGYISEGVRGCFLSYVCLK